MMPRPNSPRVFRATRRDELRSLEAGDLIVWDEDNLDMPYSLVRPLTMVSAAERLGAAGVVEVPDPSEATRASRPLEAPPSLRQSAPHARHQKRA